MQENNKCNNNNKTENEKDLKYEEIIHKENIKVDIRTDENDGKYVTGIDEKNEVFLSDTDKLPFTINDVNEEENNLNSAKNNNKTIQKMTKKMNFLLQAQTSCLLL